ncbi:MAG: hypothetical protein AMK73_06070 [Planctomycetes bacterium SM23_32]|nr:MAG: hypothetical protein AMK73_06070 [Planctomycetes bacterium SM23_32]
MEGSLWWILVGVPISLAICLAMVFLVFSDPRAARERRRRMMQLAEQLGLRYYGTFEGRDLSFLPACALFERGEGRAVANLLGEDRSPPRLVLFDYGFKLTHAGRGRNGADVGTIALYLVAMARLPDGAATAPACIYREDWFGGPVGVRGLYRVKPEGDDEFAGDFWLTGEPREAVEAMLTPAVRAALKGWEVRGPRPVVEILTDWAVAYVDSAPRDRSVGSRGAALLKYASRIAAALSRRRAQEGEDR